MAGFTVYDAVLGALTLRQCRSASFTAGGQVIHGRSSGAVDPSEIYGGVAEPRATFETFDVAGLLGGVSATAGLSVASGTIAIPFQKRTQQGTFVSGSNHFSLTSANGLIIPVSIGANQDDEGASAQVEVYFRSTTGFADPVTLNTGQALGAQAYNALYAMGPVSLNGSALSEVIGWRANFGIQVESRRYNGGVFPMDLYIVRRQPSIELTFRDLDARAAFAATYTDMTAVNCFLRKRSDGGTFVADASTVHVKVSFTDGIIDGNSLSANEGGDGSASLMLYGITISASAANAIA